MFIGADLPWEKLKNPTVIRFLEKYCQRKIPDESTLRKRYMDAVYKAVVFLVMNQNM